MLSLKLLVFSFFVLYVAGSSRLQDERSQHKGLPITEDLVRSISQYSNVNHLKDVLNSILVPRVVGTRNHEKVKEFLISSMEGLGWEVETDPFEDRTPLGNLKFENVVARLNPDARRYLVLACHYDSKYVREGSFLGATDSAVPCAMMINLAYTLKDKLNEIRNQTSVSLKFIFFDGEEAFEEWGPLDSIYGARHLARKWEKTPYPRSTRDGTNRLHQMDLLVLLDLLGAPNPSFYNFFSDTQKWYKRITAIEKKLRSLQLISDKRRPSLASHPPQYFHERSFYSGIEDDHIPFKERGVPILHIIPYPFPDVWHTEDDNLSVVHFETVENLNKIMRIFVLSYLKTKA